MKQSEAFAEALKRAKQRKLFFNYDKVWEPGMPLGTGAYPWQREFHDAGADNVERMLMAANRVGKTSCAAAETAIHLIGEYPSWWKGHRFEEPIKAWAGGETNETLRDVISLQLLGQRGEYGTGWIPGSRLVENGIKFRQAGVSDVVDTVQVWHKSGGISTLGLKSYEQGVKKWRGTRLDWEWLDEEPPQDIFSEAQTRILDRKGRLILTFTPHNGPTEVVRHFTEQSDNKKLKLYYKNVTWDDAPHLGTEEKERLWASYPPHERETRARGIPMLGAGAIFPIDEKRLEVDPFPIPEWWRRINGVDFGIAHPASGVFCAHDSESDTFYIYDCYKAPHETAVYHAEAMKKHGTWIPTAWPRDGMQRDKGSGEVLKDQYRKHGLYMLPEFAAYKDERGNHVEPGLIEMYEYMRSGKFRVFSTCRPWFEEKRTYHRDDKAIIVKNNDDIMDASRYAFVMRRYAQKKPASVAVSRAPSVPMLGRR